MMIMILDDHHHHHHLHDKSWRRHKLFRDKESLRENFLHTESLKLSMWPFLSSNHDHHHHHHHYHRIIFVIIVINIHGVDSTLSIFHLMSIINVIVIAIFIVIINVIVVVIFIVKMKAGSRSQEQSVCQQTTIWIKCKWEK